MPSFLTKTFSSFFNRILQIDQSGNSGVDSTTRAVQTGDGVNTSISLSDDVLQVQPQNDNTTGTISVKNKGGDSILAVDTTNSIVKAGVSRANVLTLTKEMGLWDFSPAAGYHYPLVANNMMHSDGGTAIQKIDSMFGNDPDPATSVDISDVSGEAVGVACFWRLPFNITIDGAQWMIATEGADVITFHIYSYTLDTTTNKGDLSAGNLVAHSLGTITATATDLLTASLYIDDTDIDMGDVIVGFVESDSTTDLTCSINIQYHIR